MSPRKSSSITLEEIIAHKEEIYSQINPNHREKRGSLFATMQSGSKKMAQLGCNDFYRKIANG